MNALRKFGHTDPFRSGRVFPEIQGKCEKKAQGLPTGLPDFGRLTQFQQNRLMHGALGKLIAVQTSPEQSANATIQQDFKDRFSALASDKDAFHKLMREVYGQNYDPAKAEAFRQKALTGDFSWLPKIEFQSDATLQGANGAYDASRNVVYLNEKFKNDPEKAAEIYSEEVGAFLDKQLNTSDTIGDEGEMFRRLLHGEKLSAEQKAEIRADDDRGVIYVNGKATEVEFWNPIKAVGKAISGGAKALGDAVSGGAKAIGDAVSSGAKAIGNAVSAGAKAVWNGFSGLVNGVGNVISGGAKAVGKAAKAVGKAIAGAAKATAKGVAAAAGWTWGAVKSVGKGLWDAAKWTFGAIKTAWNWTSERFVDGLRSITTGIEDAVSGAVRNVLEGAEKFTRGIGKIFKGKFGKGLEDMGLGLAKVFVQTPVDFVLMLGGRAVSAVQTQIGIEDPSRPLNEEEIKLLREVYGDSIDYSKVRIKEGPQLFTIGDNARTHGNVIHLPKNPSKALLIHEMGHVWQHQHGGTDYMSEALWAQAFDGGQNVNNVITNQTPWDQLNREQQAELLRQFYLRGYLPTKPPGVTTPDGSINANYVQRILQEVKAGRGAS